MGINYQAAVNITASFSGEPAVKRARDSLASLDSTTKGLSSGLKSITGGLKALAGAYAVRETVQFVKSVIDLADELNDLSNKTGIGVQALSNLKAAAEDNGVEFESLQGGLKKFSTTITQARSGSKQLLDAFDAIGISAKEVRELKPDELLFRVSDQFKTFADGPEKAAAAAIFFGRAVGPDLVPLLDHGSEALQKFGVKISDDFAKRADLFNDTINKMRRGVVDFGVSILTPVLPALQDLADGLIKVTTAEKNSIGIGLVLGEALRQIGVVLLAVISAFSTLGDIAGAVLYGLGDIVYGVGEEILNFFTTIGKASLAILRGDWSSIGDIVKEGLQNAGQEISDYFVREGKSGDLFIDRLQKRFSDLGVSIKNIERDSLLFGDGTPDAPKTDNTKVGNKRIDPNKLGKADDSAAKRLEDETKTLEKYRIEKQKEIDLRKEALETIDKDSAAYQKHQLAVKIDADNEKFAAQFKEVSRDKINKVTEALKQQELHLIDVAEQQKETFGRGAAEAFSDYLERARNTAAQVKELFTGAFNKLEDALVDFVKTGKLDFKELADFIETELIRIAIRKAVLAPILGAIGGASAGGTGAGIFANGGIMTSSGPVPLHKYAGGGIASSPQVALFGEGSKPEAYVPLPDGRSIPVSIKGANSNSTSVQVNVNIQSSGASSEGTKADDQKGRQLGELVSAAVKTALVNEQRPGGLLSRGA